MNGAAVDPAQARAGLLRLPFAGFLRHAAQAIVDRHRDRWPDLSGLRVLVPDLHAAVDVARALAQAGGGPLLLPQITTVAALASAAPLALRVVPQSVREVELYAALARREPFAGADVWALAAELVALFDRMTLARSPVAHDLDSFAATLREAYRAGRSRALEYEATLVHELWWAQAARAGEADGTPEGERTPVDGATALSLRLAAVAASIDTPLYALALEDVQDVEAAFLDACARRVPVLRIEPDAAEGDDPLDRTLDLAWPPAGAFEAGTVPPLRERAALLASVLPDSPLSGRLRLAPASSLEQQAVVIDVAVRQALVEGRGRIAVVALDRLVARRARALLERAGVAVADEAGWLLSTTVAAACVGRLLDVVASRGYHRDLVDLLRSPFVFADLSATQRQAAVACLERTLARHDLAQGVASMIPLLAAVDDPAAPLAHDLLVRVSGAIEQLDASARRPLSGWMDALSAALDTLGARAALGGDAAGGDLLELLALRRAELQPNTWRVNFAQWRSWFARTLERANFRPDDARGQVVFTWLAATRLRSFDCLVFAGADAAHLPADDPPGSFFNQQVRARLGLPTRARLHAEAERSLRLAIAAAGEVLVTWQALVAGEPALPSPWFARLQALHRRAWPGVALGFEAALRRAAVRSPPTEPPLSVPVPASAPAAVVPPALAPRRLSVSAYQSLVDCPYRFHAQFLLGLRLAEEVTEALEKSDFGEAVHGILARFHADVPSVTHLGEAAAIERLQALSQAHFAHAMARNFLDRAWLLRWMAHIPAYVEWQLAREAEGWQVAECEADRTLRIETPAGRPLELRGRLDRIDRRPDGAGGQVLSVVDYKAQAADDLRKRAADPSEHVQLPCYVPLAGTDTVQTLFLSIQGEAVSSQPAPGDPRPAARANLQRLGSLVDRIHDGTPMPANGIEATCSHCDIRGLCRRDHWSAPAEGEAR
jgi:ATP-dependent helicase/nuclease subunit B